MKKIILFAILIACYSAMAFAQSSDIDTPLPLSEDASLKIIQSEEYQNLISRQNQFLDIIRTAIDNGTPLETIKVAYLKAVSKAGDDNDIYKILFTSRQAGDDFLNSLALAKSAYRNKYKFITDNPEAFECTSCKTSIQEEVSTFFKHFNVYDANRAVFSGIERVSTPVCGSYWNQVRLGACFTVCGALTGGLGAAACGWGCWCRFCSTNSQIATVICAD